MQLIVWLIFLKATLTGFKENVNTLPYDYTLKAT